MSAEMFRGCLLEMCMSGEANTETYLVEMNVAWRPAQAGRLAFLLQYRPCEDRDLMDVEQRMGGF